MYSYLGGHESVAIAYRAAVAAGRGACRVLQWLCRAGDCGGWPRTGFAAGHRRPRLRPIITRRRQCTDDSLARHKAGGLLLRYEQNAARAALRIAALHGAPFRERLEAVA